MSSNLERYENDLIRLSNEGNALAVALQLETVPEAKKNFKGKEDIIKKLPDVRHKYQAWYSEALAVITQLLPERVEDFKSYYAPKGVRKEIMYSNYTMTDYLRGTTVTRYGSEVVVGPSAAITPMHQQYLMIDGLRSRFKSSLYDIKTLLHADLLDDELQAAEELNKKGFQRGAGAVAGVVLEGHLASVCARHAVKIAKKDPAISDLNDQLKAASVIDVAVWRFVQHLGDLRNKCDHKKTADPTKEEVAELIEGVRKITKTVL